VTAGAIVEYIWQAVSPCAPTVVETVAKRTLIPMCARLFLELGYRTKKVGEVGGPFGQDDGVWMANGTAVGDGYTAKPPSGPEDWCRAKVDVE
jgi:hypothetical protein